jgi:hypothetical protein
LLHRNYFVKGLILYLLPLKYTIEIQSKIY